MWCDFTILLKLVLCLQAIAVRVLFKVASVTDSCLFWQPAIVSYDEWFHCLGCTVMWLNKSILFLHLLRGQVNGTEAPLRPNAGGWGQVVKAKISASRRGLNTAAFANQHNRRTGSAGASMIKGHSLKLKKKNNRSTPFPHTSSLSLCAAAGPRESLVHGQHHFQKHTSSLSLCAAAGPHESLVHGQHHFQPLPDLSSQAECQNEDLH